MRLHNPSQGNQRARELPSHNVPKSARRLPHLATHFSRTGQRDIAAELTSGLLPWAKDTVLT